MTMHKDVIRGAKNDRNRHIGRRVKFYRECKETPIDIFAGYCGIEVADMCSIEAGRYKLDTVILLKISEVLGIPYADLFETDDGRYYSNIDSRDVINCLFDRMKSMKVTLKYIGETLEIPRTTYHNWSEKRRITNPFDMQNVMSLLKVTADDLRMALAEKTKPAEVVEEPEVVEAETVVAEEPVKQEDRQIMMDEVIKACEMYRNVGSLIAELDEIIEKAQKLKLALGGN